MEINPLYDLIRAWMESPSIYAQFIIVSPVLINLVIMAVLIIKGKKGK